MKQEYLALFADRWLQFSIEKSSNPILVSEVRDYHLIAKDPDSGASFRRFYSCMEPLHLAMATSASQQYSINVNTMPLSLYSKSRLRHVSLPSNAKVVVLKGTIDLAHGDVLRKQILNLDTSGKRNLILLLIDYHQARADVLQKDLGCLCIGLHDSLSNASSILENRYLLIAEFLLANRSKVTCCFWWGIPFGMIFTFSLHNLLLSRLGLTKTLELSWVTVKHHFSWSESYLDSVYTSLPLVDGFDPPAPTIKYFKSSFYSRSLFDIDTATSNLTGNPHYERLSGMRSSGKFLMTSASRSEKTDNQQYISALRSILMNSENTALLVFGNKLSALTQSLIDEFSTDRVLFLGWASNIVPYMRYIDLFLDPFPFGAGMTFVAASMNSVPCISTGSFVHQSPSTISILKYLSINGMLALNEEMQRKYLFGSAKNYSNLALKMIQDIRAHCHTVHEYSQTLRADIACNFCDSSDSLLA